MFEGRKRSVAGWRWRAGLVVSLALHGAAWSLEPTPEPVLAFETGMHTAEIFCIATDRGGRLALTGSDDKTARVWEVASGRQLAVLRPPQGPASEGKVFAVALSPDGTVAAVAGSNRAGPGGAHNIFLFDTASGRMLRRIAGLSERVDYLAYTPDGRWLAASLRGAQGLRVFDARSGVERGRDTAYDSSSRFVRIHLSADGRRLVSTAYDGRVRLYALEEGTLRLLKSARPGGGERPHIAQFSPDGRLIAVAFADRSVVQVLDAQTLAEHARPASPPQPGAAFFAVAWSDDGTRLMAAGRLAPVAGLQPVRVWSAADWSRHTDEPVAGNSIESLRALPQRAGGGWLFAAFGPSWGVLDGQGRVRLQRETFAADFRGPIGSFQVSGDGRLVRFGYRLGDDDGRYYDPRQRALADGGPTAGPPAQPVLSPRVEAPGLRVSDWRFHEEPKLNGVRLPLEPTEKSRSLAIAPDGQRFVLGADWTLRLYDRAGKPLWMQLAPDLAWAVNITQDNRFVVAAYADGTVRWHRLQDGREVLALFVHADRQRWVAWTAEGYFDASPSADELIGFHLNQGADREGRFVSARQLWETFYQPALIARRLDPEGDQWLADQVRRRGDVRELLRAESVPEVVLESPAVAETEGSYLLKVRVRNAGEGVGKFVLRVDGAELSGRWNAPALAPDRVVEVPVDLGVGAHRVTAEWVDGRGIASSPVSAQVSVRRRVEATGPILHVLTVGISRYRDKALSHGVSFAAEDARAVGAALESGARGLFAQVRTTTLADERGGRDGIEAAVAAIASAARPDDTVVIYLAGHGVTAGGDYHFLPWETRYTNFDALAAQSLSAERLRQMLGTIAARKLLLLLDTCSAGRFSLLPGREIDDKASIDRLQRGTGRALIAATADEKMALEGEGGHGVFTYSLLRALEGDADKDRDGLVTVGEVAAYVDEQVPAITRRKWGYEQFPMLETRGNAFALTRRGR